MTSHEVPVTQAPPPERTIPRGFVLLTVIGWITTNGKHTQEATPTRLRSSLILQYAWDSLNQASVVQLADSGQDVGASIDPTECEWPTFMLVQERPEAIDAQLRDAAQWVS